MTMHMLPVYYNTTNTKKRKKKKKPQSLLKAEANHAKWREKVLGRSGERSERVPAPSILQKGNSVSGSTLVSKTKGEGSSPSSPANIGYHPSMAKKKEKIYTGEEIIGIAVMHKSNAIPIRGKKQAVEVARMRRG